MRIRTIGAGAALAGATWCAMAGVAQAQEDLDCADFATQPEAQAVYAADPRDPNDLDRDDDGIACESRFVGVPGPVERENRDTDGGAMPTGSIEAGAGGTADDDAALLPLGLIGGGALAVGAGAALVRRGAPRG